MIQFILMVNKQGQTRYNFNTVKNNFTIDWPNIILT